MRSKNMFHKIVILIAVCFMAARFASAQTAPGRYALILEDPPIAERFKSKESMRSAEAADYRREIEKKQEALRKELDARKIRVTGAVSTVLNAVFVIASKDRLDELRSLSGVKGVVPMKRYHMKLDRATQLMNGPAAWNILGGVQNAGTGVKIAILDSGIDQTQPAFQDSSLPMPAGYPICSGADCAYTNNKVIVARSYVRQLAAGSAPDPSVDSRPDDYSPRDRDGHGTAVASCAAGNTNTGLLTFSGMAPKAYLGNYKIYGSPGLNDGTTDDVIIQALDDAVQDGMDIISFSSGGPPFSGPLDTGAACGNSPGVPCDLTAQAFEEATRRGVVIVAAGGNEGNDGINLPTLNSISSPANAPSVIAAGASTNSHEFVEIVAIPGAGTPSNLKSIATRSGDATVPLGSVTGTLVDVTQLGNDGLACSTLPFASLVGSIALIERGSCDFAVKLENAEDAGAIGVIFYMADQSTLISPIGLSSFPIPAVMISNNDGLALKIFLEVNPGHAATIDPNGIEANATPDRVAFFSSIGPSTGDNALKPDLLAVGTNLYMAGEGYDPFGALYSSNGYVVANGTSFSTPLISGAAALVKQRHPDFTADQIKSILMNTAANTITMDDSDNPIDVRWTGAGKLDAGAALTGTVTVTPGSVSFGAITSTSATVTKQLQVRNAGSSALSLNLSISSTNVNSGATLRLDKQQLSLQPGASDTVTFSLTGTFGSAGAFYGNVVVQGAGATIRVPFLYTVPSRSAANLIPLAGDGDDGIVGEGISGGILAIRLVDSTGIPIAGAPVSFAARNGSLIQQADQVTDVYGIAVALPVLGSQPGAYLFTAVTQGLRANFTDYARTRPTIAANGVADAANLTRRGPFAPGSYIAIFGAGLSDFADFAETANLPLQIDLTYVSFDVPSAGISVPGHLLYASPGQINVQVPWELQGQSSVRMKVSINYSNGNVVTVPLATATPELFAGAGGIVAAIDGHNQIITTTNPVGRGQALVLFANGLGPVTNQPGSGEPAPTLPLAETTTRPVVMIGGQQAAVSYSGMTPGYAGLYQLNVTVPSGIGTGMQPVIISMGGYNSKALNVPVQ